MSRTVPSLLLASVALLGWAAQDKDDDPVLHSVPLTEWLDRLKGDKEAAVRPVVLLAVGVRASGPSTRSSSARGPAAWWRPS